MSTTLEDSPGFRSPTRAAIASGLVILVTIPLWRIRDVLTLANFSWIYLLLTLVIAVWLGTVSSLVAAFVSFFCFNAAVIRQGKVLAPRGNMMFKAGDEVLAVVSNEYLLTLNQLFAPI